MLVDEKEATLLGLERRQLEEPRKIKLRLPVEQVMKLHRLRILKGQPISRFVAKALDSYFEHEADRKSEPVAKLNE